MFFARPLSALFAVVVSAATLLGEISPARAAEPILQRVNPNGTTVSVEVPANYPHNTVSFYTVSRGNQSLLADIVASAPGGAVLTARSILQGRASVSALSASRNWNPVNVLINGREAKAYRFPATTPAPLQAAPVAQALSGETPVTGDPCAIFSQEFYDYMRSILRATTGVTLSNEQICAMYTTGENPVSPSTPGGTPGSGGTSGGGYYGNYPNAFSQKLVVHKDSCGQRGTA